MQLRFTAAIAVFSTACGARSGLGVSETDEIRDAADGRDGRDAAVARDATDAADAPDGPCDRPAPAGAVVWRTPLPTGVTFTGPQAADASGNTYFLGLNLLSPNGSDSYFVIAIDSCGRQLWFRGPVRRPSSRPSTRPTLLLSGDQVIVKWTWLEAYDRVTGAPLWDVNLGAIAGGRWRSADMDGIAVAADGTSFVALATSYDYAIVSIGPTGNASLLATNAPRGAGGIGGLSSVIVDGAGQIDLLLNSTLRGALVESFSTTGAFAFSSSFSCTGVGILGPMASGSTFIAMQTGPCAMTFQGKSSFLQRAGTGNYEQMAVDGHDNLYVASAGHDVYSFDSAGRLRWTWTGSEHAVAGPFLTSSNDLFVATADLSVGWQNVSSLNFALLDMATGSKIASYPVDARLPTSAFSVLLTAAEQLVFVSQNNATAVAAARKPSADAAWPTPSGGADNRRAARGR